MPNSAPTVQQAHDHVRHQYGHDIGRRREELITPALVLDIDAAQRNIDRMASELRKYGLDQFVLDWDSPTIFGDLLRLASDADLPAKLARMQAAYADYHSVSGYARVIHRVFEETRQ